MSVFSNTVECYKQTVGRYVCDAGGVWRPVSFALFGLVVLVGVGLVRFGDLNADEGFYLLSARLIADGKVLFHDFGITQPPGLSWVYSLLLDFLGWDLLGVRLAGLMLTVVSMLIAICALKARYGWLVVVFFLALLLSSPGWLAFVTKGKTYALTGLATACVTALAISERTGWTQWVMFVVLAAIGCLTRLSSVVFFLMFVLWFLRFGSSVSVRVIAVIGALIGGVCLVALVCWGNVNVAKFWMVDFHTAAAAGRSLSYRWLGLFQLAPWWILVIPACCFAWKRDSAVFVAAIASLLAIVANVAPSHGYGEYATPFVVPSAIVTSIMFYGRFHYDLRSHVRASVLMPALACFVVCNWFAFPDLDYSVLDDAADAARFVRESVEPSQQMIATMPEVAVAAERKVPLSLVMGKFAFSESLSDEMAISVGMVTPQQLGSLMADENTAGLILSAYPSWNFAWSMPELRFTSNDALDVIRRVIGEEYYLAYNNKNYVVFLRKGPGI